MRPFHVSLKFSALLLVAAVLSLPLGCTKKSRPENAQGASSPKSETARTVHLAIWSNYISQELLTEFERRTGIHVVVSQYSSNEELLAKLQAGASGYDVAVPSDYMIYVMAKLGLLRPLNLSLLTQSKNLDPRWMGKSFDLKNTYSLPYDWGTTGIAINKTLFPGKIAGWKDLFRKNLDPSFKFSLLDDAREVIGAALKSMGYSLNSKNLDELEKAKALLLEVKSHVKAFTSEPLMPLTSGESAISHVFMSDALQARRTTGGKIQYVLPEEGSTLYIDGLVIPATSVHVSEAHEFINFLLEAKSNLGTVMSVLVAPANLEAFKLLPTDLKNDRSMFPSSDQLRNCEMVEDLGDFLPVIDRIWTEIKAK